MKIIDLPPTDENLIRQTARILMDAFALHWPNAWPTFESALEEVHECLTPKRVNRIAVADDGRVLGWVGAEKSYKAGGWELHPLAVDPLEQGKGIGRALMTDIENQVLARGGITIYLGSDDEDDMTSLAGVDLFDQYEEHLKNVRNLKGHPFEFYQKMGYQIIGVMPDVNGPGKPDIWMAKRIRPIQF
jgi:aminoglycoside 6'-N-acetyltransferase I